ncbi:MAG TPA: DNA polymerase Y family protein, partial [Pirellulales bacterium]|nr:DNA polymerase Y family protein [Pirellulales bacterium]
FAAASTARVVAYCPRLATAAATPWQHDSVRTHGIEPGMPLAEATALAAHREQQAAARSNLLRSNTSHSTRRAIITHPAREPVHLELADPAGDRTALERLADWCHRYSPTVGVEEADEPESLLLDVTGLGELFGNESALAAAVLRGFGKRGLAARVAIADTPGAAWALAQGAPLSLSERRSDARAIFAAIAQLIIIPPGHTCAALAPLPIETLRLPAEPTERLHELGLERIEQLAALPRSTLFARFGPLVLQQLDRATGLAPQAIVARGLPPEWKFERPFEYPTAVREMIEHALEELVLEACRLLAHKRQGMLRLECRFEHERHPADQFVVGMYRPTACPRHALDLVRLKLEALRFSEPVSLLEIRVLALDELEFEQREMFEPDRGRDHPRELAGLVDRLSNRLGSGAVLRPWLLASAQPEFACQYAPYADLTIRRKKKGTQTFFNPPARKSKARAKTSRASELPLHHLAAGDRPCRLEIRPRRLQVLSVAPEGPPMQFRLAGQEERVARVWGPERIETGWWRSRLVRRDYYQVETTAGARYWLFRELASGSWFLHGKFD